MFSSKPFIGTVFVLFLVWLGYCLLPANPTTRIEHTCEPVSWSGRLVATIAGLVNPTWEFQTLSSFGNGEQRCRYMVWKQFYGDEYFKEQARLRAEREAAQAAAAAGAKK